MEFNKNFPHSTEAEQAILSCLILDKKSLEIINDYKIVSSDFFIYSHSIIFDAIIILYNKNKTIDTIILFEYLSYNNLMENKDFSILANLEILMPSIVNLEIYCRILKEKSVLRKLINFSTNIIRNITNKGEKSSVLLESIENEFSIIKNEIYFENSNNLEVIINKNIKKINSVYNDGKNIGLLTGFYDLDNMTSGFHPGELIIIASRPSMGKTALALNIFSNLINNYKTPVAFFSLEMNSEHILYRLISSNSNLNLLKLRNGKLEEKEFISFIEVISNFDNSYCFIDDSIFLDILDIKNKARSMVLKNGVKLIIIDYLQLITSSRNYENKVIEISEISKSLKNLARELNIPIIALSQLNRGVENRIDKRPLMSDLRESGSLEQDADLVLLLYREEYYLRNNIPLEKIGLSEIIISKNRNGPTGIIYLKYFHEITKFVNFIK